MVEGAHVATAADQLHEQRFASQERHGAQIQLIERQQIEDQVAHGHVVHRGAYVERALGVNTRRDALEARPPSSVERHHLAIEHDALRRERGHGTSNLRIAGARGAAVPVAQRYGAPVLVRDDADAVDFQLVDAARIRELGAGQRAKHGLRALHVDRAPHGAQRLGLGLELTHERFAPSQVRDRHARQDAERLLDEHVAWRVREGILLLDQEPLVALLVVGTRGFASPGSDQREAAMQLETIQLEVDFAQLEPALRARFQVANASDIPGDHGASAVVALGDHLLEVEVFERMILGHHGKLLVEWREARAPWHREALQRPTDLQA